jgi:hypothetical protein
MAKSQVLCGKRLDIIMNGNCEKLLILFCFAYRLDAQPRRDVDICSLRIVSLKYSSMAPDLPAVVFRLYVAVAVENGCDTCEMHQLCGEFPRT